MNKNKKKKKKQKIEYTQYSNESINLKVKTLYLLSLLIKIAIITPFINIILVDIISKKITYFITCGDFIRILISLTVSLLISILLNKKEYSRNPLFLDDRIVVSNRQKSNGYYENIYLSKFVILLCFNIFCIIPLSGVISLTISNIICFLLNLITIIKPFISILKYLFAIVLLKILVDTFNQPLISYLRNRKE